MAGELPKSVPASSDTTQALLRPEIRVTRMKQFSVRFGHVYKVFLTYEQAYRYAGTLSRNAPIVLDTNPTPTQLATVAAEAAAEESATTSNFLSKAVLNRVLECTYTDPTICIACIIGIYRTDGGPTWQETVLNFFRGQLRQMLTMDRMESVPPIIVNLVKAVFSQCGSAPTIKDKPDRTIPKGCGGLSEPQVSETTNKKKRTIRKLMD